jgi:hypothetical protein
MSIISFAKDSTFTCFGAAASYVIKRDKLTNSRAFHDMTVNAIKGHGNVLGRMHTIREFIPLANFNIIDFHVDKLFNGMKYGIWIMVNDGLLEWMGYPMDKETDIKSSRKRFGKLVSEFDPEHKLSFELTGRSALIAMRESMISNNNLTTIVLNESNIDLAPLIVEAKSASTISGVKSNHIDQDLLMPPTVDQINGSYPVPEKTANVAAEERMKYHVIQPKLFHETVMSLPGDKGKRVRRYFTTVNELMIAYDLYQQVYQIVDAARAKCDLEKTICNINSMLENAKIERADMSEQLVASNGKLTDMSEQLVASNGKLTDMSDQLTEATDEVGDLSQQVGTLNINVDTLHDRLGAAAPDHVYPAQSPALSYVLMLYGNGEGGYKCIRTQHRNKARGITSAGRVGYHNHVLTIPYAQGAINSWHVVRDSFRGAKFIGTTCILTAGAAEADLVAAVSAIDTVRRVI